MAVSGTEQDKTPESLVAPAFAGFPPVVENGTKAALTTGMTTDRKNFILPFAVVSWQKSEYPGIAKLVSRLVWEHRQCSHRTKAKTAESPLTVRISGGLENKK